MMKRITSLLLLMAVCVMCMAQGKLTPQAQLSIAKQKVKVEKKAARAHAIDENVKAEMPNIRLVMRVDSENAVETYRQIKEIGGVIRTKLGNQVTISIPVDSVPALEKIEGVLRIDTGHKGRLKTDVTRKVTGVSQLNGVELPEGATSYTGKGVTVCVCDDGIDFQHPAFKDSEGNSRIKCIYVNNSEEGRKFTVNDPEAGEYTFPGSVFDTPELIAKLTTDDEDEYHGTHTTAIAAGSISPQGFGGMAPEADIVLIPVGYVNEDAYEEAEDAFEEFLAFAAAYADQSAQPMVLSASLNSHAGPHDGTSSITYAIQEAAKSLIPVFSAGNEGGYPVHLHHQFTAAKPSIKTFLMAMMEGYGDYEFEVVPSVTGYTRQGDKLTFKLSLKYYGMLERWSSPELTYKMGDEPLVYTISGDDDAKLAKEFDGDIALVAMDNGDGRVAFHFEIEGGLKSLSLFEFSVAGDAGTEFDMWDDLAGFGGSEMLGMKGYTDGDSDMSAGDWTCTKDVISVGSWCANTLYRYYDGTVVDMTEVDDEDDMPAVLNDISGFSSYGVYPNGIEQPVVCAPGSNIVSAWSQYSLYEDDTVADNMQWNGAVYGAESGTSMACPVVSGIVALWLQANPHMTIDDVKEVMAHSSTNDEFTAVNTLRWGYGKINAKNGIDYILGNGMGVRTVDFETATPNAVYDLQGRRVSGHPTKGLYIYKGKKVLVR